MKKIFLAACCLCLWACQNDLEDVARIELQSEAGIERAEDIEIYYSDSAIVRFKIKSPLMLYYMDIKNPRREFPKGITADFFDYNQQPSSQLSARYAIQTELNQKILLRDSVVIWNNKQERLETEELLCDERAQMIHSEKFVKIQTPTYTMFGYGLHYNLETTDWTLDKVSGTILTNKNGDTDLN
jgi:LPS export ABC transporter protein LptC